MSSGRRRPSRPFVVSALLLGVAVALVGGAFLHTDDGCAVEKHCLTCQRIAGSTAVIGPALVLSLALETRSSTPDDPTTSPLETPSRPRPCRGPPQA